MRDQQLAMVHSTYLFGGCHGRLDSQEFRSQEKLFTMRSSKLKRKEAAIVVSRVDLNTDKTDKLPDA